MNPSRETLDKKLIELETVSGVREYEIQSKLKNLRSPDLEEDPCQEWIYEVLAFSFSENYTDQKTGWGTYFGPMSIVPTDDGKIVESPSIQRVDEKVIAYWSERYKLTNNPLLQARYAGLVWDLSEKATGKKPDYSAAVIYCEALLKIAECKIHKYEVDIIEKLERALFIATSINNQNLIEKSKEEILDYESLVAEDSKPGLWGFSFDLLVNNKKVNLSEAKEKEIIDTLEARLQRLKDSDPWDCEEAAERLGRYYRRKGLKEECSRIIKTLGDSFETAANNVEPLAAFSLLEHIHKVYIKFDLIDDAERIRKTMRSLEPKVRDNMTPIYHEMEIDREQLKAYIEQILDGNLEQSLARIVIDYIPSHEQIKNQLYKVAKQYPIPFLITKNITDDQGRKISEVGSLENDLDGNIVFQMCQNMTVSMIFLSTVLEQAIKKFSLDSEGIINYLFHSPVFASEQRNILLKGIQAYLEEDYIIAVHLLIPQIEAAIRNLVQMSNGVVLKSARGGGFHLKALDELLRSEQVKQSLGEDIALYLRVILTDQRGWNVRNNVCHGIFQQHLFSKSLTERLIHILLILAQLRLNNHSSSTS
ncbi:conserved hypothetical protein [Gloeothece citriformis PCC 7424]|uniref:DUF4209 domain-containing protein n=1 Tax=Gloeothece citriformis (strain PCC 7424) TaxID=65393 RepID=B7KLH4_GLOC7|nr:DUF4209 domain-containing protein [Gloeothece citriformis]ACK72546.1 conserved hypothetical protein [Gloeothece citriformis PCC 7424]